MKTEIKIGDIVRPCFPAIPGRAACIGLPHVVLKVWEPAHIQIKQLGERPTAKIAGIWDGSWDAGTVRHCNSWITA